MDLRSRVCRGGKKVGARLGADGGCGEKTLGRR